MNEYIEAGKIINTHGVAGELKLEVWLDSADYMKRFKRIFVAKIPLFTDNLAPSGAGCATGASKRASGAGNCPELTEYRVLSLRNQKGFALAKLEGVTDINMAMELKNRTVYVRREDAGLKPGEYFLCDIVGASVVDDRLGEIGVLKEIFESPAQPVYVVRGETEHLIPAVPEFVKGVDFSGEIPVVHVSLIEGM